MSDVKVGDIVRWVTSGTLLESSTLSQSEPPEVCWGIVVDVTERYVQARDERGRISHVYRSDLCLSTTERLEKETRKWVLRVERAAAERRAELHYNLAATRAFVTWAREQLALCDRIEVQR